MFKLLIKNSHLMHEQHIRDKEKTSNIQLNVDHIQLTYHVQVIFT